MAVPLIVTASPAGAEAIGDCSTTNGVIVVVDFAHWGGTIEKGCAATPTTGVQALHTAGFTTAGVAEYAPTAFVCRIDTDPDVTQTSCAQTPPASAYWTYWHADPGQTSWSYSNLSAATYKPPPGSVTAWVFGGTNGAGTSGTRPPFTPTQVRATNITPAGGGAATTTTTPAPTTTTTAASSGGTAGGGTGTTTSTSGGPSSGLGAGGASPASSTTTSTTTAPPAAGAGSTTTAPGTKGEGAASTGTGGRSGDGNGAGAKDGGRQTSGTPRIVDVSPTSARTKDSSGSPTAVIVGAVVIVLLAAGGGVIAWRRRQSSRAN